VEGKKEPNEDIVRIQIINAVKWRKPDGGIPKNS